MLTVKTAITEKDTWRHRKYTFKNGGLTMVYEIDAGPEDGPFAAPGEWRVELKANGKIRLAITAYGVFAANRAVRLCVQMIHAFHKRTRRNVERLKAKHAAERAAAEGSAE